MRLSLICVAGCVLPGALALPSTPGGSSQHLEARAKVKLNQYRTMSDWYVLVVIFSMFFSLLQIEADEGRIVV